MGTIDQNKERERQNQDAAKRAQQKKDELNALQAAARREEERKQKIKEAYEQGVGKVHKKNAKSPQATQEMPLKIVQTRPAADAIANTTDRPEMRMQMQMDRFSKSTFTISNVQKKSSETASLGSMNFRFKFGKFGFCFPLFRMDG